MSVGRSVASALALSWGLTALAYQAPLGIDVELGAGFQSALTTEGFHDPEAAYRWTRAFSTIVVPDIGARAGVRLELVLSGFRPRGAEAPLLAIEALGRTLRVRPPRTIEPYVLEGSTGGVWSSSLSVVLRSDTFSPGRGDERALGVRVHRARLEAPGALTVPPLRQLLAVGGLTVFVFLGLSGADGTRRVAFSAALFLAFVVAIGYAFSRLWTALSVPPLALAAGGLLAVRTFLPAWSSAFVDVVAEGARTMAGALASLGSHVALASGALAVLCCTGAFLAAPRLELELGSGRAAPLLERFGGGDLDATGTRFRRALDDARIDLRDFGWGSTWRVSIRARAEAAPASGLARVGEHELEADLVPSWSSWSFDVPAPPPNFRAGHVIDVPVAGVDIASVSVDRGRSLPSTRALVLVLLAWASLLTALRAAGLDRGISAGAAAASVALLSGALALEPVLLTPLLGTVAAGAVAGAVLAAWSRATLEVLHARGAIPALPPAALAIGTAAFLAWFLASASPLYSGGHFVYHSSVAERIWEGDFLLYYLPGPDNMLARQPQWGSIVVPHPSFYHTVASPLAGLPEPWPPFATKLFLAGLLFVVAVASGLVATHLGGRRAGVYAVAVAASTPVGFQLLGLGHLMTIFGCFASALALGFLAIHIDRLSDPARFRTALLLVTLSFLAYTGSLLFGSACLVAAALLLSRAEPDTSRRLAVLVAAAWGLALAAYYAYWVVPFLTESVPAILAGSSGDGGLDLGARLAAVPRKLDYTYGSFLVPAGALLGIGFARLGASRVLLACWASVLVAFSGLDLFFNFLLKHHYFSLPAVAAGLGLALERLEKKGRWGKAILAAIFVYMMWTGFREAWQTARGGL